MSAQIPHTPSSVLEDLFTRKSDFYDITQETLSRTGDIRTFYQELHQLDRRNEQENRFHAAVAAGNTQLAIEELKNFSQLLQEPSFTTYPTPLEPLRNFKLSIVSMNAILRKEMERNHVPNIYINHHASRFTWLIENARSFDEVGDIVLQMIRTYCKLSRHYSLAAYSLPIKNTLQYINSHIEADLSVKTLAAQVGLSPNYLSALFKKEVGATVTDYVLQKRVHQSCFLLKNTAMSVQDIASVTGISDANYFTKLFKKRTGMTPLQYRRRKGEEM